MIKKKIQDYFDEHMGSTFNNYLRPQLEEWINKEIINPRNEKKEMAIAKPIIQQNNDKIVEDKKLEKPQKPIASQQNTIIAEHAVANFINELKL